MDIKNHPQIDLVPVSPQGLENPLLQWIARYRWAFFAFVAVLLVAGYNGQWRIGRDSALYRTVAHNLASGNGFTFRGQRENHSYPGLPLLLAGVEKVFGGQDKYQPRASLLLMLGIGAATLLVVYHLVRTYYPPWIAVCVTTGLGINLEFLQRAHELMTDAPFLLGICMTLLGITKLDAKPRGRQLVGMILLTVAGVALILTMRPTFWAFAAAWLGACVVGMARQRIPRTHRIWYAAGIVLLVALVVVWIRFDPRLGGGSMLNGKYEKVLFQRIAMLGNPKWQAMLAKTLDKHLPFAMFGFSLETLWPLGPILFLSFVIGAFTLMRKSVLWGLYVLATLGMIVVLGSVPRYFLMILPLLLVEWAVICEWTAARLFARWRFMLVLSMMWGLGLATAVNFFRSADFIMEQHGMRARFVKKPSMRLDFVRKPFLEIYREGSMKPLADISRVISRKTPRKARVLGVEPRILTYLSDRHVFQPTDFFRPKDPVPGRDLYRMLKAGDFQYCVWGPRVPGATELNRLLNWQYIRIDQRSLVKIKGVCFARIVPPRRPAMRFPDTQPAATRPVQAD